MAIELQPVEDYVPNSTVSTTLVPVEEGLDSVKSSRLALVEENEDSPMSNDLVAGFHQGLSENFTSSLGTVLESYMPIGRLFAEDKSGDTKLWQSTQEWLGVTDEQWDKLTPEARRVAISKESKRRLDSSYQANEDTAAYNIARFVGMLTDPTTAIPVVGTTLKARMAFGAAVGGADVATYEAAQEGAPTLAGTATGVVLGGAITGTVYKLTDKTSRMAKEKLKNFETNFAYNRLQTDSTMNAYTKTLEELGETSESISELVKKTGHKSQDFSSRVDAEKFIKSQAMPTKSWFGASYDKVFEPVSERLKKISPSLWFRMVDMERKVMDTSHRAMLKVDPFIRRMEKELDKATYNKLWKALSNSDRAEIESIIVNKMGQGAGKDYALMREALDDLYKASSKTGRKIGYIEEYFPRWVKDYDKLKGHMTPDQVSRIQKILDANKKDLGRDLTKSEVNDIYNKFLRGYFDSKDAKIKIGSAQKRQQYAVSEEQLIDAYASPSETVHSYIREMADDIHRRQLFNQTRGVKDEDNLTKAITEFVTAETSPHQIDELKKLLELRFIHGTQKPKDWVKGFKNMSYSSFLGNPMSALVQLGDVSLAAAKIGTRETFEGIAQSFGGRGFTPKEFGLTDNIMEEFVSSGKTKRILDQSLKWSGFKSIDSLGKRAILNGGINRAFKYASSPKDLGLLRKRWALAYGKDYPMLEKALKNEKYTREAMRKVSDELHNVPGARPTAEERKIVDMVKSLAFAELADIQPITLLEMPEVYLKYPNMGRTAYMLKTFSVKYLNLLRRDVIDTFASGNYSLAIKRASMLYGAYMVGGVGTDMLKDSILGRDPEASDLHDSIMDNTLRQVMLDRYSAEKLVTSREPTMELVKKVLPPVGVFDPVLRVPMKLAMGEEVEEKDFRDVVKRVPLVGPMISEWLLGGGDYYREQRIKKSYE